MKPCGKWIWRRQAEHRPYNQTVVARRWFKLPTVVSARIAVTADSWYRLFVNGRWVNDGPCRSWPEHYQYDEIDVLPYVIDGINEIRVIARHFGTGTFHQVPCEAGLNVSFEAVPEEGEPIVIGSNAAWEIAELPMWLSNTPKISIQMEPFEHYDARLEAGAEEFARASVIHETGHGPWKNLISRDCALLTRRPFKLHGFLGAKVVKADWTCFTFPVGRMLHPRVVEANHAVCNASALATYIVAEHSGTLGIEAHGLEVTVNGERGDDGEYPIIQGPNLLLAVVSPAFGHQFKEPWIIFEDMAGCELDNPIRRGYENPWCFAPLPESDFVETDIGFALMPPGERAAIEARVRERIHDLVTTVRDETTFRVRLDDYVQCPRAAAMLMEEPHQQFVHRQPIEDAEPQVEAPEALMRDDAEETVVHPNPAGDVELAYDLGEQNCGYYEFSLSAEAGVVVDIFGVEYVAADGTVQHTGDNRNGLRYICKQGENRFASLKRRSGRYLFITLRNMKGEVRIRHVHLIESTYPVKRVGAFSCSDPQLGRVWDISARTLKLCMEDTFTDCPLYEQTLWVGDARNEALFAFTAFGAEDLARRCIRLAGESLERYPLVGCQVPSCWDTLIPAWSFLWNVSICDYYFYTGDGEFLRVAWDWVVQNLRQAQEFLDENGLFSAPFWNMFDWTGIDDGHRTVLHNSMFLVGAIDAARKCAGVLGDIESKSWLRKYRSDLANAINACWDPVRKAYPDSIHEDGVPSKSVSQHTSFLAILFDIVSKEHREDAVRNMLQPPESMVRIGSPFAILYLYEALEKAGYADRIVPSIRDSYIPMLDAGATTVWECFPSSTAGPAGFPTRSHCHAWSSAPIHFLNRVVLGIHQTAVGGASFDISPRLSGLQWAKGATATINGPVRVEWRRKEDSLEIRAAAPRGTRLRFVPNRTHKGLKVFFNGGEVRFSND